MSVIVVVAGAGIAVVDGAGATVAAGGIAIVAGAATVAGDGVVSAGVASRPVQAVAAIVIAKARAVGRR
ncbi:hypothetical protein LYSHEL_09240 [Lysobacter helvus]|uniref:Uncharacterized protein n=2 Tax=Lysobacteraceae TaxID=32033 RepID=A0ABN6FRE6_9GAMM|nr:hypothetical protein LYSCAS_09240 [Lysobacter caseinilyticus]BCT95053.1 hypothetical protein LYSHEL_09240 [Lysobacter helvus]